MKRKHKTALTLAAIAVISAAVGMNDVFQRLDTYQSDRKASIADEWTELRLEQIDGDGLFSSRTAIQMPECFSEKQRSEIAYKRCKAQAEQSQQERGIREKRTVKVRSTAQTYVDILDDISIGTEAERAVKKARLATCNKNHGSSLSEINTCYYRVLEEEAE